MKNDYLKGIIDDEEERKAIYEKAKEREEESERHIQEALLEGKIKRIESNKKAFGYIAVGLAAAVVGSTVFGISTLASKKYKDKSQKDLNNMLYEVDDNITLTEKYTIVYGDTLTSISRRTGIPIKDIQMDNDISNPNMINIGQRLELNHIVSKEDIGYYIESVPVEGRYISQIAGEYNTTIKTLCDINRDSIIDNKNGTYTIISDTILVPNFISQNELKEAQAKGK